MSRVQANFTLQGRVGVEAIQAKGQDFSLEIEMLDANLHLRKVNITGRELPDGTLSLVIDGYDVWSLWDHEEKYPPSHDSTIQIRTHKSFAVRAGTAAHKNYQPKPKKADEEHDDSLGICQ